LGCLATSLSGSRLSPKARIQVTTRRAAPRHARPVSLFAGWRQFGQRRR
jgi:hypothetical protein